MNRREFLQSTLAAAALGALASAPRLPAGEAPASAPAELKITRRSFAGGKITLPLLGFGMMRLPTAGDAIDAPTAEKMIARAFASGLNYFDTAYMYHGGQSEKFAGEALKKYPRDSFMLTSKLPVRNLRQPEDMERIFNEQLTKCQTPYFDFYMLHALNAALWERAEQFHAYDFLLRKKAEGKIRYLGFSFHDTPEVLQKIAGAHPWDFAQIQLNYLDWELYRSREQYEILTKAQIPVIVMEPLRGGTLARLNPGAVDILRNADAQHSPASWGLRYAASLPNVVCVLSGMTRPEHLEDNLRTFSPFIPLADNERQTLAAALTAYRQGLAVPCTSCNYCQPCPVGVAIPKIFGLYNQYKETGNRWQFGGGYQALKASERADACVKCRRCVKACPQHIDVIGQLQKIAAEAEPLLKG